jgi:hypothetical protein
LTNYEVDISIDGGLQHSNSGVRFNYYSTPKIKHGLSPPSGPIEGGTTVTIHGDGFNQANGCNRVVRLGHMQVDPTQWNNNSMTFIAPAA